MFRAIIFFLFFWQALSTLKVEKLIIPAIAEHMNTWTEKFNFSPLKKSHNQEMRSMNMLVFPRTDMLQKILVKRENMEGSTSNHSGEKMVNLLCAFCPTILYLSVVNEPYLKTLYSL